MTTTRYGHTATALRSGDVLVAGGFGGNGQGAVLASAELYRPAQATWQETAPMRAPRADAAAVLLSDGDVLVAGGLSVDRFTDALGHDIAGPSADAVASAEVYRPTRAAWSTVGPMTVGRVGHTLTVLQDGRVLAAGGRSAASGSPGYTVFASAELFDPATGRWAATAPMANARICHTATLLPNGNVLVAGGRPGRDGAPTAAAQLYDPLKRTWTRAADMSTARCGHTATLLPGGKVLVAGGASAEQFDEAAVIAEVARTKGPRATSEDLSAALASDTRPYLKSAELYDPVTNRWSPTGNMTRARAGHAALLLSHGNVLVARGQDRENLDLDSADLYHAETGTWSATGSMHDAVGSGFALAPLPDGTALATGGDRGFVKSRPGFRERLARGVYRAGDFAQNSALRSTGILGE